MHLECAFRYGPEQPEVLRDLFTIRRGERIGIIGDAGSGKALL